MLFDEQQKQEIEKELQSFLEESKLDTEEIIWGDKHLDILLKSDKLVEAVQSLYAHYHE